MCSKFAACPRLRNGAPVTLPLPRARHARSTHAANTPSPTNAVLLPHSLETNSANRKATAPYVRAIAAAPPTPAQYPPVSQSIDEVLNDVRLALAARPAARGHLRIRFFDPFPAPQEKFPSDIPASSRNQTLPIPLCLRKSQCANKLLPH